MEMNTSALVLPYEEWRNTLLTVHRWTQILGKIQLTLAAPVNNH